MEYGIFCRLNGADAYVLTVSDGYASIERWGKYKLLKEDDARERGGVRRLRRRAGVTSARARAPHGAGEQGGLSRSRLS